MKSKKIIVAALVAVAAIALAGCSPRSSMATLSTDSDSETAEVFSLAKVLNLGTNYLTSLDYDNAILQYIDIIQHDPTNKEAYAGLYAAYAAQGKADEANKVFEQAQEVFDDEADFSRFTMTSWKHMWNRQSFSIGRESIRSASMQWKRRSRVS